MTKLYDADLFSWAIAQAEAARRRSANEMDWDNVAEELEALGNSQRNELYSRFVILLQHLLKWRFQPERRSRSWKASIQNSRDAIAKHMKQNPGLKQFEAEEFVDAYREARRSAAAEMDAEETALPEESPFSLEEARADDFWPEPPPAG